MCGIIGYTGSKKSLPILIEGLRTLEYRGYDSAGVTVAQDGCLVTVKSRGRLTDLEAKLSSSGELYGSAGIGHTRWATHGEPSDKNSHPHSTEHLTLVHNGIIENYAEIEEMLRGAGYDFVSETDTERGAKLVDMFFAKSNDPIDAISRAIKVIRGSYAFGIIFKGFEDTVYAIRKDSPLIVAHDGEGGFIASDIPAILKYTSSYYRLDEGIIAKVSTEKLEFFAPDGSAAEQKLETIDWDIEQAQKGGFPHFMIKEINEEPEALRKTLEPRIRNGLPHFGIEAIDGELLSQFESIHIVACGTAMHAGLIGKAIIEKLARIPVNVEIASEFRYRDPILRKRDLVILISQSGETADTLAALRHAKAQGVYTLAIVNVIGSSVAREADSVLYTWAGPEIAVASTKAYSVQCAMLYLLAVRIALAAGAIDEPRARQICDTMLSDIPTAVTEALKLDRQIYDVATKLVAAEHLFYIGRDVDFALSTEASLKLKEISYIHSEAYAAGELKHGTISLVTDGTPVIALTTVGKVCEKTVSGIREVKSRGAYVVCVCAQGLVGKYDIPCDDMIVVPEIDELLATFPAVTVLQLLAYHVSALKGLDVDKPRNLAKSVTVE
ncbi:MAG: glutamine--fructose-6-phosphate transaminase (isomerizing) [Ruminococcaceae bacterium]|nr:glutamine--fructose-6-phosphate transaminase (isomerizing) [Oscillospiraceae bacterium]